MKKGSDWEKVKKQDGMSTIIVNYSDKKLGNKVISYLHCSNISCQYYG